MTLRAGLTYDLRKDYLAQGLSEEETAEFDSEVTIDGLDRALTGLGFKTDRIGNIKHLVPRLAKGERWDFVLNICEGLHGIGREAQVPALLEAYAIPCVFADTLTACVTLDKGIAKLMVANAGVPTPPFAVLHRPEDAAAVKLPFPVFAKPVAEGSGKGVSAKSRAANAAELRTIAAELLEKFKQPVLVETFLSGREFTVGVTGMGAGARAVACMEVLMGKTAEAHGYSYDNKENWEGRIDYRLADDAEGREAAEVALAAWRALGCRDGGRVDIRSNGEGRPHFLEVNPLAGLNPEKSDLVIMCRLAGLTYEDLIGRIVAAFLDRNPALKRQAGL